MLEVPNCYVRHCKHYQGILQPDGTEMSEVNYCKAFPHGIPDEIAYGDNEHSEIIPGQVGKFVYEEGDPRPEVEEIEEG